MPSGSPPRSVRGRPGAIPGGAGRGAPDNVTCLVADVVLPPRPRSSTAPGVAPAGLLLGAAAELDPWGRRAAEALTTARPRASPRGGEKLTGWPTHLPAASSRWAARSPKEGMQAVRPRRPSSGLGGPGRRGAGHRDRRHPLRQPRDPRPVVSTRWSPSRLPVALGLPSPTFVSFHAGPTTPCAPAPTSSPCCAATTRRSPARRGSPGGPAVHHARTRRRDGRTADRLAARFGG